MHVYQKVLIIALIAAVALVGWGLLEPYILLQPVEAVNLSGYEGPELRVVQLADFQVGMTWDNTQTVEKAVKEVVENPPDMLVITGDFIYHDLKNNEDSIARVVGFLEPLQETNIPVYSVLGNHDYAVGNISQKPNHELARNLTTALEGIGITVLENEYLMHESLAIVGIGSLWANNSEPATAFSGLDDSVPRIVLVHNPDSFADIDAHQAPIALAGHTHGGQIRIPFLPESSWVTYAKDSEVHTDGWIPDYGQEGNELYVNRGIGFSKIPMRINAAPEMTHFIIE